MKAKKKYNRYVNHISGETTAAYKMYRNEMDTKIIKRLDWVATVEVEDRSKYIPAGENKNV